jgi:hypothetical protein
MTAPRAAAYIGGALLLLAWLSSAAGVPRQPRAPRAPRPAPAFDDALAFDVQAQAERLRKRLASAPVPQQPARNPFVFTERRMASSAPSIPREVAPPAPMPVSDPEPELTLAGIAEQQSPKGLVRTALITGPGDQYYMVVAGQPVAGRYLVVAVGADAVELKDVTTDRVRRLALR